MDQFDRYFQLHRLLKSHRFPVSRAVIEERLEVSSATVKRIIRQLRNYGVPIEYNREQDGYTCQTGMAFELPGMWFSADELAALMTAHDLLANAAPGLLSETLSPLMAKLDALWKREHLGSGELRKRVRILRLAGRDPGDAFQLVCRALAERKRLGFDYDARTTGEASSRSVSPQRLTHYRDNWYLDAWCHQKKELRSFAVERIHAARIANATAKNIAEKNLHEHFASAYGIFAGKPRAVARLVFSAFRARWVAEERWHPAQQGEFLPDGRYQLDIPYSDTRELIMDILKNGLCPRRSTTNAAINVR